MSLYNALHGVNPIADILLSLVGVSPNDVPRFRDCYIDENKNIAIHTRTGGGNRDFYENAARCKANYPEYFEEGKEPFSGPWNDDLRALPGYLYDQDDDFDCTYATFYFKPDNEMAVLINQLHEIFATETPGEKWQKLFADMEARRETPRVKKALEVGRPLFDAINNAMKDEK